jgi:hypothetical protein
MLFCLHQEDSILPAGVTQSASNVPATTYGEEMVRQAKVGSWEKEGPQKLSQGPKQATGIASRLFRFLGSRWESKECTCGFVCAQCHCGAHGRTI